MRGASGHSLPRGNQGLRRQQVQLSRGHWRREDAAGAIRSVGWWESVTVTWSPTPAPGRRPAVLRHVLAAVADVIAPVLADVAVASTRRVLDRRYRARPIASSVWRQLASAARNSPGQTEPHDVLVPVKPTLMFLLAIRLTSSAPFRTARFAAPSRQGSA